jgi:hypothetical protein
MSRAPLILLALSLAFPMASCSNKSPANTQPSAAAAGEEGASATAALGKATFSALVDGQPVSGGAIDDMQQQNAAYTLPSGNGGAPTLLFYLFDSKVPNDPTFTHSFRFQLAKALGPASDAHLTLNVILDPNHTARYNSSTPTITITSLTPSRVAGTFSGKMSVSPDTPNAPKTEVTVTDGKFDIPMATSKLSPS